MQAHSAIHCIKYDRGNRLSRKQTPDNIPEIMFNTFNEDCIMMIKRYIVDKSGLIFEARKIQYIWRNYNSKLSALMGPIP